MCGARDRLEIGVGRHRLRFLVGGRLLKKSLAFSWLFSRLWDVPRCGPKSPLHSALEPEVQWVAAGAQSRIYLAPSLEI